MKKIFAFYKKDPLMSFFKKILMIKRPITKESYVAASLNHTKRLKKRSMDNIRNDLTHLKN